MQTTKEELKQERCRQCIVHAHIHPKFQHTPSSKAMQWGLKDTLPESVDSPQKIKNQITSFSWKSILSNLKSFPIAVFSCPCTGLQQVNYTHEEDIIERWGKMEQLKFWLTGIGWRVSNGKAMVAVIYKCNGGRDGNGGEWDGGDKWVSALNQESSTYKKKLCIMKNVHLLIKNSFFKHPKSLGIQTGGKSMKQWMMIVKWTVKMTIMAFWKMATLASSQNLLRQNFNQWR